MTDGHDQANSSTEEQELELDGLIFERIPDDKRRAPNLLRQLDGHNLPLGNDRGTEHQVTGDDVAIHQLLDEDGNDEGVLIITAGSEVTVTVEGEGSITLTAGQWWVSHQDDDLTLADEIEEDDGEIERERWEDFKITQFAEGKQPPRDTLVPGGRNTNSLTLPMPGAMAQDYDGHLVDGTVHWQRKPDGEINPDVVILEVGVDGGQLVAPDYAHPRNLDPGWYRLELDKPEPGEVIEAEGRQGEKCYRLVPPDQREKLICGDALPQRHVAAEEGGPGSHHYLQSDGNPEDDGITVHRVLTRKRGQPIADIVLVKIPEGLESARLVAPGVGESPGHRHHPLTAGGWYEFWTQRRKDIIKDVLTPRPPVPQGD